MDSHAFRALAPDTNLQAYPIIYSVENVVRELIIDRLEEIGGPRWYKRRLPGDILQSYRKARELERKISWSELVPHHPIYYVDFPALKKIIERNDNWKDAFQQIFRRKDIFSGLLSAIEPIRNKLAHNRLLGSTEVQYLSTTANSIVAALGDATFSDLSARSTSIPNLPSCFKDLRHEGTRAFRQCDEAAPVDDLTNWSTTSSAWWFDESFVGQDLSPIKDYFNILDDYRHLARPRGIGHKIEEWLDGRGINNHFALSDEVLAALSDPGLSS